MRDPASYAFGVTSVAAALDVPDGVVLVARLALAGGWPPLPWRARTAEQVLAGRPATAEWFGRAADAELAAVQSLPAVRGFRMASWCATVARKCSASWPGVLPA